MGTVHVPPSKSARMSGAVDERVVVTAILTLLGWMVDRKAPYGGVYVLNPKDIY